MESSIFEQIKETCPERKVVSRCNNLLKKSRLTSGAVARTLTELGYWLYVYGYINEALKVCEFSHIEDPKVGDVNYNVWSFLLDLWGLEAYIYRKQGDEEKCRERITQIDRICSIPSGVPTVEAQAKLNRQIRDGLTYEYAIREEKIKASIECGDKAGAKEWRFIALYSMIGRGVTGFYPHLEEHKDDLEEMINQYLQLLK